MNINTISLFLFILLIIILFCIPKRRFTQNETFCIGLLIILLILSQIYRFYEKIENFQNEESLKPIFYAGMTSIPQRLPYIHHSINSILQQKNIQIHKLYVFLPNMMKRKNLPYDISQIQMDKIHDKDRVEFIQGVEDEGPITKFYSLLDYVSKKKNHYLILIDDDVIYPHSRLTDLKKAIQQNSYSAIGFSGRKFTKSSNGKYDLYFYDSKKIPKSESSLSVDLIETFDLTCFPRDIFPNTSKEFLEWFHTLPKDAFYVDDIVISYWCHIHNIPRHIFRSSEGVKFYSQVEKNIPQEVLNEELQKENLGPNGRNRRVFRELWGHHTE